MLHQALDGTPVMAANVAERMHRNHYRTIIVASLNLLRMLFGTEHQTSSPIKFNGLIKLQQLPE